MLRRKSSWVIFLALIAVLALGISPALAHHKDDHTQGKQSQKSDHDGDADNKDGQTTEANDGDADDATDPNEDDDDNAHPSGKDRSVENGGSGNQGNSESDPDDDGRGPDRSNGGPDKPGGSGGVDAADQDGNNGCGNDDDFEDDNEGWCGGKPKPQPTESPSVAGTVTEVCDKDATMAGIQPCEEKDVEARGSVKSRTDRSKVLGERLFAAPGGAVRAAKQVVAAAGAALPFTGVGTVAFLIAALGLLGLGWFLVRREA